MATLLAPESSVFTTFSASERLSAEEFRMLEFEDESCFYELLHGEIVKRSAPSLAHQRIAKNIFRAMDVFVEKQVLGEMFFAPADVALDDENVLQPDVFFVAAESKERTSGDYVQGAPDLVIEVVSVGTVKRDRGDKMKLYERCGVREYWLVDARTRSVEVYVNAGNDFNLQEVYAETQDLVSSLALQGFEMPLQAVFEGIE
jgi:Uma2 family endonuclease